MGGWRGGRDREAEFDFHDFSHGEAEGLGAEVVRAAWERGCPFVILSHGAGNVPASGFWNFQRGSIKRMLYSEWCRGEFMEWAYYRRSVKHSTSPTWIRLALRPNPHQITDDLPDFGTGAYGN
jgi:hypothetical protein